MIKATITKAEGLLGTFRYTYWSVRVFEDLGAGLKMVTHRAFGIKTDRSKMLDWATTEAGAEEVTFKL